MSDELQLRSDATQATLDYFKGSTFELGKFDCFQMARFQCEQLGQNWSLLNIRDYTTPQGAKRALLTLGCDSILDFMDKRMPILPAPAFARVGDILAIESDNDELGIGSVVLYLGNKLILSYHANSDVAVTSRLMVSPIKGWSVI